MHFLYTYVYVFECCSFGFLSVLFVGVPTIFQRITDVRLCELPCHGSENTSDGCGRMMHAYACISNGKTNKQWERLGSLLPNRYGWHAQQNDEPKKIWSSEYRLRIYVTGRSRCCGIRLFIIDIIFILPFASRNIFYYEATFRENKSAPFCDTTAAYSTINAIKISSKHIRCGWIYWNKHTHRSRGAINYRTARRVGRVGTHSDRVEVCALLGPFMWAASVLRECFVHTLHLNAHNRT